MKDKIFENARFFMPPGKFEEKALLVRDDTIAAVLEPGEQRPAGAEMVDLAGRFVIPGFVDGHFHLLGLALKELRCDLSGAGSAREAVDALVRWGEDSGGDGPVVGVEWDQSCWVDQALPTRDMLDAAFPKRPVYARRICCHVGIVNSAFLGLLQSPKEFINAETGFITEDAVFEANRISYPAPDAIESAMAEAIKKLHRLGITTIHDVVEEQNLEPYLAGLRSSPAPLRVDGLFHVRPGEFDRVKAKTEDGGGKFFKPVGVKVYTDGSLGGHTAALNSPYSDAQSLGDFLVNEQDLAARMAQCLDKGLTFAIHAIGDRALRTVLAELMKFPEDADVFRIEHAEIVGWDEMVMLQKAPVYLSVQPNFVRNWQAPGGLYEKRLGKARWDLCNPFASFADNGIPYFFGSDGMPPGPLYGLKGAIEHPKLSERIPAAAAIGRYTETAGALGRHPRNIGRLEKGYRADLAVLSGDPTAEDVDAIDVEKTFLGGSLVFEKSTA